MHSRPKAKRRPTLNQHDILVVEDDPAIGRLLSALLRSAGYEVHCAVDGTGAIARCIELQPAVVFLDVSLPDVSGWDVLAQLRRLSPEPPQVVLLTGDSAAIRRAREAGAAAGILKPFDIDEVLNTAAQFAGVPVCD